MCREAKKTDKDNTGYGLLVGNAVCKIGRVAKSEFNPVLSFRA